MLPSILCKAIKDTATVITYNHNVCQVLFSNFYGKANRFINLAIVLNKLKFKNREVILKPWQNKLHEIIYEADTKAGKLFDVVLLVAILLSVLTVMLESVPNYNVKYLSIFVPIEWTLTILFTLEYILRIVSIKKPFGYIFSFYGLIDLMALLPTYISLFVTGTHSLAVIRSIRLLRVFRILKLSHFLKEADVLTIALKNSKYKIFVFLLGVVMIVIIMGTVMYLVEGGPDSKFDSIPRSIYWSIITLTTVGYGDISPATPLGQAIASIVMIFGYAILAVPTGIVTNEIVKAGNQSQISTQACLNCSREGHDYDAKHCKYCGTNL